MTAPRSVDELGEIDRVRRLRVARRKARVPGGVVVEDLLVERGRVPAGRIRRLVRWDRGRVVAAVVGPGLRVRVPVRIERRLGEGVLRRRVAVGVDGRAVSGARHAGQRGALLAARDGRVGEVVVLLRPGGVVAVDAAADDRRTPDVLRRGSDPSRLVARHELAADVKAEGAAAARRGLLHVRTAAEAERACDVRARVQRSAPGERVLRSARRLDGAIRVPAPRKTP